jgi:tRNA (cytidine/uridine-2'-O-)-methyltransferase
MDLVLFQPQIPGNTGTIGRMCVGLDAALHVIGPCAFDFSDKAVRRAGLDHWPDLRLTRHDDPAAFLLWLGDRQPWLVSKFGRLRYDAPAYRSDDIIVLGNEVRGLPPSWHERWSERCVHLPILGPVRSFNLANVAAVVLTQAKLASGAFAGYRPPIPDMA